MPPPIYEIMTYRRDLALRAGVLLNRSDDERRNEVRVAIQKHDVETLQSWFEAHEYAEHDGEISRHTLRNHRYGLNTFLEFVVRKRLDILNLSRRTGTHYKFYLTSEWQLLDPERQPLSPPTIGSRLTTVRRFYVALKWMGMVAASPFDNVRPPKDLTKPWDKRQAYAQTDLNKMLNIALPEERVIVLLGSHAGLRIQEMVDLAYSDIDFQEKKLKVACGKGRRVRTIPMSKSLAAALAAISPTEDMVFSCTHQESLSRRLKMLCEAAGVKPLGMHSLRHSCGTRMMDQTNDLVLTARLLGHRQIASTRIYAKWNNTNLRAILNEW